MRFFGQIELEKKIGNEQQFQGSRPETAQGQKFPKISEPKTPRAKMRSAGSHSQSIGKLKTQHALMEDYNQEL